MPADGPGSPPGGKFAYWALGMATLGVVTLSLCLRAFVVRSGSMRPTLEPGDVLLAETASVDLGRLARDRIYSLRRGDRWMIKRVVGLPGDEVSLRGRTLRRDGRVVPEPYARYSLGGAADLPRRRLGPGLAIALGDNRDESRDSRVEGPGATASLGARVFFRVWPLKRFGPVQ